MLAPAERRRLDVTYARRALPRFLAIYGMLYAAFGVHSPYFPTLLQDRGLDPEAIGMVLASGAAVRLIAGPAAGRLADRLAAPKMVLASFLGMAALVGLLTLFATGLSPLLLIGVFYAAATAPLAPLTDTLALGTATTPRTGDAPGRRLNYGWLRGAGSAAFILGSIVSGNAVSHFGIGIVVVLNSALLAAAALCTPMVPVLLPPRDEGVIDGRAGRHDLLALLRSPLFRRLLLAVALILGSHALHDAFVMLRWKAAGIGPETAGLLWSEQVAAEVIVFFFLGHPLLRRLGSAGAVALASVAGAVRWATMAETAWLPAMAAVEPLHGITFALLHLASMRLLAEIVPPQHAATALALYATVIGAASALSVLASGPLYAEFGARGFWVMAALSLAALPIAWRLQDTQSIRSRPRPDP